jgi:hypothetical protein
VPFSKSQHEEALQWIAEECTQAVASLRQQLARGSKLKDINSQVPNQSRFDEELHVHWRVSVAAELKLSYPSPRSTEGLCD